MRRLGYDPRVLAGFWKGTSIARKPKFNGDIARSCSIDK